MRLLVTPDGRDSFWLAVKPSSYTPPDRHADYLGVVDWITVLFISLFDWKGAKYRLNRLTSPSAALARVTKTFANHQISKPSEASRQRRLHGLLGLFAFLSNNFQYLGTKRELTA